jgi:transposase
LEKLKTEIEQLELEAERPTRTELQNGRGCAHALASSSPPAREEIIYPRASCDCLCPLYDGKLHRPGEDHDEVPDIEPVTHKVVRHVRQSHC